MVKSTSEQLKEHMNPAIISDPKQSDALMQTKEDAIFSRLPELESRVHSLVGKYDDLKFLLQQLQESQVTMHSFVAIYLIGKNSAKKIVALFLFG